MKKSDLPLVALNGRRAGELVAAYGESVWDAVRAMGPGPRASRFDPDGKGGWRHETVVEDGAEVVVTLPNDTTGETAVNGDVTGVLAARYQAKLRAYDRASRELIDMVDGLRHDRAHPVNGFVRAGDPGSDSEYCRHHLVTVGTCEPRYRGDACRACYDFELVAGRGLRPPKWLLVARGEGRRWTEAMVNRAVDEARRQRRRRKAS